MLAGVLNGAQWQACASSASHSAPAHSTMRACSRPCASPKPCSAHRWTPTPTFL